MEGQAQPPAAPRLPAAVQALLVPDAGMSRAARVGRARGPLLFAMACALLYGAVLAARIDAREATLKQLDKDQKLATMSDRQIEDAQRSAERAFMVKKLGAGLAEAPAELLASALGLFALSWLLRGRSQPGPVFTVSAYALLPSALGNLLSAGAAWMRSSVAPDGASPAPRTLAALADAFGHPVAGAVGKLLGAFDVFDLWGAALLGFGLAAAAQLPPRRALAGTLVAWICYRLVRFVALGGQP